MTSTPQKTSGNDKSPGGVSPVLVQESPTSKTSQKGNLTGNPRIIRDYVADAYNLIQKWNTHQILGGRIINNIVAVKTSAMEEEMSQTYPEGLQELCDQLEEVCTIMNEVVASLRLISDQVTAVIKLERIGGKEKGPIFITWPVERFGEVFGTIHKAYAKELKVKHCVKENIAHMICKPTLMVYAAAWAHQPFITSSIDLALESMLLETGHR